MKRRAGIARVDVPSLRRRGTCVLVGDRLVLTAFHVVADRHVESPIFGEIWLRFPRLVTNAQPVPGMWSATQDWILLECKDAPADAIVPLGEPRESDDKSPFETFGFPDMNPDGMEVTGRVIDVSAEYKRQLALQLFSPQAAAGNGAPLAGLSGAPCIVDGAVIGILRSSLLDGGNNVGGTLYACPITVIFPAVQGRLPLPDPVRGLPGLPVRDLPVTPFRYLHHYTAADCEVFFGRAAALRSLYEKIIDPTGAPIILLYGQSGVGKSSLLDAGITPRLQRHHYRYIRRHRVLGLKASLESISHAQWSELETTRGRPAVIALDQIEEAWTRPTAEPDTEVNDLLGTVAATFAEGPRRPRGKLILSLRKEWLPELEARLLERQIPFVKQFLERLDHNGIVEIVHGIEGTERSRRRYGISVQPDLGVRIAADLLSDYGSPIAPTLQVLMTRLWERADKGVPRCIRDEDYEAERRSGIHLSDFIRRQLDALPERSRNALGSGIVDEILEFHTTALGTAETVPRATVLERYLHVDSGVVKDILDDLTDAYLLTTPEDCPNQTRLAHDTLAPIIRERFLKSQRPGQRARRVLEARAFDWDEGRSGSHLDENDVGLVEKGRAGMRALTPIETRLVAESMEVIRNANVKEQARQQHEAEVQKELQDAASARRAIEARQAQEAIRHAGQLRRRAIGLAVALCLTAIAAVGTLSLYVRAGRERDEKEVAIVNARRAIATRLASESAAALTTNPTRSALLAIEALRTTTSEAPPPIVEQQLQIAFAQLGGRALGPIDGSITGFDVMADHGSFVLATDDGALTAWNLAEKDPLASRVGLTGHPAGIWSLTMAPVGPWFLSIGVNRDARLQSVATRQSVAIDEKTYEYSFSRDGRSFAYVPYSEKEQPAPVMVVSLDRPADPPMRLDHHRTHVNHVIYLPGGNLVTASKDSICIWDLRAASPECLEFKPQGGAWNVRMSPQSRYLLARDGHQLDIWDTVVAVPAANRRAVNCDDSPTFSSDESFILCGRAAAKGNGVLLMPTSGAGPDRVLITLPPGRVGPIAIDPKQRFVASANRSGAAIHDLQTGTTKHLAASWDDDEQVDRVEFIATGILLIGANDSSLQTPRTLLFRPNDVTPWLRVMQANLDKEKTLLVTTTRDHDAQLWTLKEGPAAKPHVLRGQSGRVSMTEFSADRRWLVTSGGGKTFLWDLKPPIDDDQLTWRHELKGHGGDASAAYFGKDGRFLVTLHGGDDAPRIWDLLRPDPGIIPGVVETNGGPYTQCALSPDGRWLAAGEMPGGVQPSSVSLWNLAGPNPQAVRLKGHHDRVSALRFSPDSFLLISGGWDETVRAWDLRQSGVSSQSYPAGGAVTAIAFSPDSKRVAITAGNTLRLWTVEGAALKDEVDIPPGRSPWVDVAFAGGSSQVAVAESESSVTVVDLAVMTSKQLPGLQSTSVVAASPDGSWLAAGGLNDQAILWRTADWKSFPLQTEALYDNEGIGSVAFSLDSAWLAVAAENNQGGLHRPHKAWLYRLGLNGPEKTFVLTGMEDDVKAVAFTRNQRLITASYDAAIRIWDLEDPPLPRTPQKARRCARSPSWQSGSEDSFHPSSKQMR